MTAEERRDAIIDAALPLFAQYGLNGVTTKQVAEAAGVSEALLYRHFAGKDELYVEIQRYCVHHAERHAGLDRLEPSTSSLVLGIYWLSRFMLIGGPRGPDYHRHIRRLLLTSVLEDGDFARGFIRNNTEPLFERLQPCLEVAKAQGDLVPSASTTNAGLWFAHALYAGVASFGMSTPPTVEYGEDREAMLADLVRFALRGIGLTDAAIERHFNPSALALLQG